MIRKLVSSIAAFLLFSTGLAANAATGANPSLSSYCSTSVAAYPATSFGAKLLCDVASTDKSGTGSAEITEAIEFKGKIIFTAKSEEYGTELWITDGTPAGTRMLKDINTGTPSSNPALLTLHTTSLGVSKIFFAATSTTYGRELWSTDGTTAGTTLAKEFVGGPASGDPTSIVSGGNRLFVAVRIPGLERELAYTSNSSTQNFVIQPASTQTTEGISSSKGSMTWYQGKLYMAADGYAGPQLYSFDPAAATLVNATNVASSGAGFAVSNLLSTDYGIYFRARLLDPATGYELWRFTTDFGGAISRIGHIDGDLGRSPESITAFRTGVVFTAFDPESGRELWFADGSTRQATLVDDIAPGSISTVAFGDVVLSSDPANFVVYKNDLYFTAYRGDNSSSLMKWDGTRVTEVGGTATGVIGDSNLSGAKQPKPVLGSSLGLFMAGVSRTTATLSSSATHSGSEPMLANSLTAGSIGPTLSNVSPTTINSGESITISGQNLANVFEVTLPDGTRCSATTSTSAPCSISVNSAGTSLTVRVGESVSGSTGIMVWNSYWGNKKIPGITIVNEAETLDILNVTPRLVYPGDQIVVSGTALDTVIGARAATLAMTLVPGEQSAQRLVLVVSNAIPDGLHALTISNGVDSATVQAAFEVKTAIAVSSVRGPAQDRRANAGDSVTITGTRLAKTNSVKIGGQVAQVTSVSETSVTATVPAGLTAGLYDVEVASAFDTEVSANSVEIVLEEVQEVAPGLDTEFKVWTKRLNDGEAKMYAKNVVGQGKVTFVLNGEEIAWIRAADLNDRKLRIVTEGPMTGAHYLVRTVELNPGRNVLEIYQNGERIRRTIYSNN